MNSFDENNNPHGYWERRGDLGTLSYGHYENGVKVGLWVDYNPFSTWRIVHVNSDWERWVHHDHQLFLIRYCVCGIDKAYFPSKIVHEEETID